MCTVFINIHHLMQQVSCWKVQFTYWDANRVTYNLEKIACTLDVDCIWIQEYPFIIIDLIQEKKLCIVSIIE